MEDRRIRCAQVLMLEVSLSTIVHPSRQDSSKMHIIENEIVNIEKIRTFSVTADKIVPFDIITFEISRSMACVSVFTVT